MNGEDNDHAQENGKTEQEKEDNEPKLSLAERRRKYIAEKRKRMKGPEQPQSIGDILKAEDNERCFLNVRVHSHVPKSPYADKPQTDDDLIHLMGELEIADFLTFHEIVPKAMEMFNAQLKEKGYDMEFESDKYKLCSFRYAKKSGDADMNFPSFDGSQKVSD